MNYICEEGNLFNSTNPCPNSQVLAMDGAGRDQATTTGIEVFYTMHLTDLMMARRG